LFQRARKISVLAEFSDRLLDRVYIQAKRYAAGNSIGSGAIRDFFGSLDHHKAAKGLFVTTSTFSAAARETVALLSRRIVLIDGAQLAVLMVQQNIGCRVEDTLTSRRSMRGSSKRKSPLAFLTRRLVDLTPADAGPESNEAVHLLRAC
jgi:hypothetical protein